MTSEVNRIMGKKNPQPSEKSDYSNEKDELLSYLLEQEGIQRQKIQKIPPRSDRDPPYLSFAQERFWFLDQFEPNQAVYNSCKAERLIGKLDLAALEESLTTIVRRHEVLRTTFPVIDGQPIQQIAPDVVLKVPLVDLQNAQETGGDSEILRLALEEARHPFDLTHGPLMRAKLLQVKDDQHVLILTFHQIVFDSWSVEIFFRELWSLYKAHINKKRVDLGQLPIQYADFAAWQRRSLQGEVLKSQLAYWRQQLKDDLPILNLPTDHSRPVRQSFGGAKQSVVVPESLTKVLDELSRRQGVTLFMTMLAAFKVLIFRHTDQKNVVIGCPIVNRNLPEIEHLIGSFVNTLALRTNLIENQSFKEFLSQVRDICLRAYAHQDLPFEKLVEELRPNRDLGRNPVFQVMFAFQNTPVPKLNLPLLKSESIEIDGKISKFDLTLSLTEHRPALFGYWEYNTDLFNHSTIERMAGHFQTLLEGIVANPDEPISALPLLTDRERRQLLFEWNDTKADYSSDSCIHELFEAQAERVSEAIAVKFGEQELTYRELNERANKVARYIRSLGVGPATLVGICIDRSLEMLVGLLGILKAGGAYVPFDPNYRTERSAIILRDAHVSVVLTQERFIENGRLRMEDGQSRSPILNHRLKVVCVDRDWEIINRESGNNINGGVRSNNLAYVIYTSGSTGKPKGVQVPHRSVVNCLRSIGEQVGFAENDIFLAVTTISFDIAALEFYLPLITGAKVVLAIRDEALDGRQLIDRLIECGATAMQATPSNWKVLLDAGWRGSRNFKILCGGEALSRQLADQLLEGGTSLWNLYGPTETTIWSTITEVQPGEDSVPIGRPIANTEIYILDAYLQPVPIGVHGELYIGGDGLTWGYLNRPELTAERFVASPFSSQPGARLYRTGDRARCRADGNIEFLGRFDNQVKIRGYRIELGEIETVLNQHSSVKESVVIVSSFPPKTPLSLPSPVEGEGVSQSDRNLIAYLVPNTERPLAKELRSFLKEKLPDYMIPSWFVFLDALPLMPNGKIDRNALPPPDGERPLLDQGLVEPRTEIEGLVAQVWREVLKLEKIGVYDNFFELGGHSLLATRVVARLRSNFNVDLPLRKLFELPTVAGLAEHIDFLRHTQSGVSVPPIVPVPRDQAIPLSFSQRRLWFLHKLDPNLIAYNIPAFFASQAF